MAQIFSSETAKHMIDTLFLLGLHRPMCFIQTRHERTRKMIDVCLLAISCVVQFVFVFFLINIHVSELFLISIIYIFLPARSNICGWGWIVSVYVE